MIIFPQSVPTFLFVQLSDMRECRIEEPMKRVAAVLLIELPTDKPLLIQDLVVLNQDNRKTLVKVSYKVTVTDKPLRKNPKLLCPYPI